MKRFIWVLILVNTYFQSNAHQEYVFLLHRDDVYLEYTEGFSQYELSSQIYAIFELVNLHMALNYPNYNKNIYIELIHDYTNYQEDLALLGIDSLKSVRTDSRGFEEVEDLGLRLFLLRDLFSNGQIITSRFNDGIFCPDTALKSLASQKDFYVFRLVSEQNLLGQNAELIFRPLLSAKEILNLLDYGIKHRNSIIKSQEQIGYNEYIQNGKKVFRYKGLSIPKDAIIEIAIAENTLVINRTIGKKIFQKGTQLASS